MTANASENAEALFTRFYEWAGKESDIKLELPAGANSAAESNLMEKPVVNLAIQEGAVTLHVKPFEIKSVQIRFAPNLPAAPSERNSN